FLELPGLAGVSGTRVTHLHFGSSSRKEIDTASRVAELERWWSRMSEPGFELELERLATRAAMKIAFSAADDSAHLRDVIAGIYRSWWWRLGGLFRRVRRLRSRPSTAR